MEIKAEFISVAYALNQKKMRKSGHISDGHISDGNTIWRGGGLADILHEGIEENVRFVPFDSDLYLGKKYDVIIHKLTEELDREDSLLRVNAIEHYLKLNPQTVIIDPFKNVRNVTSRARTVEILREIEKSCPIPLFYQPAFIVYDRETAAQTCDEEQPAVMFNMMKQAKISFPVICKPIEACGTPESHSMVVAISVEGLSLVKFPCVIQQYHDHDAQFFKVYVIGDDVMVFRRPSLPNLSIHLDNSSSSNPKLKSIAFDSRYIIYDI